MLAGRIRWARDGKLFPPWGARGPQRSLSKYYNGCPEKSQGKDGKSPCLTRRIMDHPCEKGHTLHRRGDDEEEGPVQVHNAGLVGRGRRSGSHELHKAHAPDALLVGLHPGGLPGGGEARAVLCAGDVMCAVWAHTRARCVDGFVSARAEALLSEHEKPRALIER